tara:strand:+ start:1293 stop:2060 length:768 start_codon:yes stop_codon:yes gene_type:complete
MQKGFSLVELSIVLVILGLLTGGILTGQSLIRAAELRNVATEFQRWQTATRTFQDKYFALPGDMRNATSFWGTATACPGTQATPSSDARTCNGDGNGVVQYFYAGPVNSTELHRFWQHLANAGLVEGTYTGVQTTSGEIRSFAAGVNAPASKLGNAHWYISSYGDIDSGSGYWWDGDATNILTLSDNSAIPLAPEEAWNIDTKLDDGKPGLGKVRTQGPYYNSTNCYTTTTQATAAYTLTYSGKSCRLHFSNILK